ncbi:MAG: phosphoenolpyruvate mutase [Candidatus Anammoxibacter sp.]
MNKKTTQLRRLVENAELDFLLEAHSGISAKIVEEAGFKGIWASGLSISAACGVRDNNEISWTQVLEEIELMSDITNIPILLDGDTGYGNFNNMRRLVKKLEQRDIAGVCIEDKLFPKTNSFLRSSRQPLADINEFCGKIKAGKDVQLDPDFVIVARIEAFIAGWGLEEALKRAEAYKKAGADAILIHSKLTNCNEVFSFAKEWCDRLPVIIVPTTYYAAPTESFRKNNISIVIWGNHMIRAAVTKMQETAKQIFNDQCLHSIEDTIVPVKELFRLQDDQELAEAEKRYLSHDDGSSINAIILAVSQGKPLGYLTKDIPKSMLKAGKKTILGRVIDQLKEHDIDDITIVAGYKKDKIAFPDLKIVNNEEHETTGQLTSLLKAAASLKKKTLLIFGDIIFKKYILQLILDDSEDVVIIVDSNINPDPKNKYKSDFVKATKKDNQSVFDGDSYVKNVEFSTPGDKHDGEWIGILKLSEKATMIAKKFINSHKKSPEFSKLDIRDLINHYVNTGNKVKIQYISGNWIDVNRASDFTLANELY